MTTIGLIFLCAYTAVSYLWLYYVAVMGLKSARKDVGLPTKIMGWPLVAVGLLANFTFNAVVGTVLFLDPPREVGLTRRLQRYIGDPDQRTWRVAIARWICHHFLDPFDPRGRHC